jgi:hypothetical protein
MEADIPGPASPPDPPQDQPGSTVPVLEHIGFLLYAVDILLGYGRHLLATIHHRAAAPTFPTIASCFGTANLATILAHLNRGILRATALENVLRARAATGRDITIPPYRNRTDEPPPAPAVPQAEQPTDQPARPKATPRPSLPPGSDDPRLFMPSLEDLEREVRRRPFGRTIIAICLDLAVVPGLCTGRFWNVLFDAMDCLGGNLGNLMKETSRRKYAFIQEQDKTLGSTLDWLYLKRDEIRERLGFLIGEPPVDPFAAAPATGPP